jgi:hypothetical protein
MNKICDYIQKHRIHSVHNTGCDGGYSQQCMLISIRDYLNIFLHQNITLKQLRDEFVEPINKIHNNVWPKNEPFNYGNDGNFRRGSSDYHQKIIDNIATYYNLHIIIIKQQNIDEIELINDPNIQIFLNNNNLLTENNDLSKKREKIINLDNEIEISRKNKYANGIIAGLEQCRLSLHKNINKMILNLCGFNSYGIIYTLAEIAGNGQNKVYICNYGNYHFELILFDDDIPELYESREIILFGDLIHLLSKNESDVPDISDVSDIPYIFSNSIYDALLEYVSQLQNEEYNTYLSQCMDDDKTNNGYDIIKCFSLFSGLDIYFIDINEEFGITANKQYGSIINENSNGYLIAIKYQDKFIFINNTDSQYNMLISNFYNDMLFKLINGKQINVSNPQKFRILDPDSFFLMIANYGVSILIITMDKDNGIKKKDFYGDGANIIVLIYNSNEFIYVGGHNYHVIMDRLYDQFR